METDLKIFFKTHDNLLNKVFGRLTVIDWDNWYPKLKQSRWICKCICGNKVTVLGNNLKRGIARSCGCLQKERASEANIVHGGGGTRLYGIWKGMRQRCKDKNNKSYGGKGIKIYKKWYDDFVIFREWALSNGYKSNLSIDRIDPNKNYTPSNCQWLTRGENAAKGNKQRCQEKYKIR
jgi:hypothetical protein